MPKDSTTHIEISSRPTWARGLKQCYRCLLGLVSRSRPTWARGLKQLVRLIYLSSSPVAPHVGAWIETGNGGRGADRLQTSRPTWARGLKLQMNFVTLTT